MSTLARSQVFHPTPGSLPTILFLSLVLPAHIDLEWVVREALAALPLAFQRSQIIFVDDGSSDATRKARASARFVTRAITVTARRAANGVIGGGVIAGRNRRTSVRGALRGKGATIVDQGGCGGGQGALTIAGSEGDVLNPDLVQYLRANQGDARYFVATTNSTYATVFMLAMDQPALALGVYRSWDRILTPGALAELIAAGTVRFFYLYTSANVGAPGGTSGQDATVNLAAWVRTNCATVPATQWQGTTSRSGPSQEDQSLQLYDCARVMAGQP